uniref:Uncharacterized protein n=1 Tax=Setaria digitata TaxID=48799 RepID=A0A915PJ46_9BILA
MDEENLEHFIMNLDFDTKRFTELENLQIAGKLHIVSRILSLSLIHIAVCLERHEIVEYLARAYPESRDILDVNGRAAIHYAAAQQNAIYDTLIDYGANALITDKAGLTAAQYRENPEAVLPSPLISNDSDFKLGHVSLDENHYDSNIPNESEINKWLEDGNVQQLEQVLLDGHGYLLNDKTSDNSVTSHFLSGISKYQSKIDLIHKAVEEGDINELTSLIDFEKLSTARDRHGMTPLHKAVLHGQTNAVRYLLAKYPSCINATNHTGRTALHYASASPTGEYLVKLLQKAGADAFIQDKFGHTSSYYQNHLNHSNIEIIDDSDVLNELITGQISGPFLQDLEDDILEWIQTNNVKKLDDLVLNGYADLLISRVYDVDDSNVRAFFDTLPQYQDKIEAIHKAIETGNLRATKVLIDRKKMAFCRDVQHLTPLHKAIILGQTEIAKYLIKNYPQSTNAMDENKRTPLHYAAVLSDGGYLYRMMRNVGANSKICDCNGRQPKYYRENPEEIDFKAMNMDREVFLDEIIRTRVTTTYLQSSIRKWIHDGNIGKLEQLVLSGCGDLLLGHTTSNPNAKVFLEYLSAYLDEIDEIHKTIKFGHLERAKELLSSKKLAIARNRRGHTPLHTAIIYEQTEIIRYIAQHFPSVLNAPDYNKRTPLHYAAATQDGGHYMKILSKAGADPQAMDNEGHTPHYYFLNNVINLEVMRQSDSDNSIADNDNDDGDSDGSDNDGNESSALDRFANQAVPHIDSILTSDSGSIISSTSITSSMREHIGVDENDFEFAMENDNSISSNSNGIYLARTVAPVLTKALTEVLLQRPTDPIIFIGDWLIQYREKNP